MVVLDPKDWQLLAFGALISLLLSIGVAALPDLRALGLRLVGKAPTERAILRTWHTYHFTRNREGDDFLRYERWDLMRRLFGIGRIIVHTLDPAKSELKYHGTVRHEHGSVVIFFKAPQLETYYVRFINPIHPRSGERLCGLVSGIDFDMKMFQTTILISSDHIEHAEAAALLKARTNYSESNLRMDTRQFARGGVNGSP